MKKGFLRTFGALFLAMCLLMPATVGFAAEAAVFTPGTYTGTAHGNNGTVSVTVTVSDNAIESIELGDHHETYYMVKKPADVIPTAIIENQSLAVDLVAGATMTSRGIVNAVADALGQAGADVNTLRVAPEKTLTDATETREVLVVGAGLAGLNAAIKLKTLGVDVILVEKLDMPGGSCLFASGNIFGPMKEEDIDVCLERWLSSTQLNTLVQPSEGMPNVEKVEKIVRGSVDLVNYYENELGLDMCLTTDYTTDSADVTKYMLRPDDEYEPYSARGAQICFALEDTYLNLGGDLRYGTTAINLLSDESGAITGAVCETRDGMLTINAQSVIMATGSITQNNEMLEKYWPLRAEDWFCTTVGATGEGLEMMIDKGAVMWDTWVTGSIFPAEVPILARTTENGIQVQGTKTADALHVNVDGIRPINENHGREGNHFAVENRTSMLIEIMDAPLAEASGRLDTFEEKASANGPFFKADTLEELATLLKLDPAVLLATVERYNGFCVSGVDEDFGKPAERLIAIDEAPFYAVNNTLVGLDITGGVKTDINARVITESGEAIPGLYAVGLASSRDFFSTAYVGGGSLLICSTMGITAAEDAAAALK